jgi:Uma2 family endonuclease
MNPIPVSALVSTEEVHRVTLEEYRHFADLGIFDGHHVELIDGLIVDMSPRSPEHENAIGWLKDWLVERLDHARFDFRINSPLTFHRSEPEPDVAVLSRKSPSRDGHPPGALFAIEVAWTSQTRDLTTKPTIYAPTIAEYWVVDLAHGVVVTHRDYDGKAYADVAIHPRGAKLTPVALPIGELDTEALFAYALAER